ncbi:MAG TPA: PAS domain-containing protein [Fimbriimonadaceae bacterium]|nr:PAS domain-containing protein [Fimbriimonadaceae bacterium]
MASDDTTAGLMKRLIESTASSIDWSKTRKILSVNSREEAIELLAQALADARAELLKAQGAMALLLQSETEHAIITLDMMGVAIGVTDQATRFLGWPAEAIIGKPIDAILAGRYGSVEGSADEMRRAHQGEDVTSQKTHVRSDGTTFQGRHALLALIGSGGYVRGFVRKIEDVTAREACELHIEELNDTIALLIG